MAVVSVAWLERGTDGWRLTASADAKQEERRGRKEGHIHAGRE